MLIKDFFWWVNFFATRALLVGAAVIVMHEVRRLRREAVKKNG